MLLVGSKVKAYIKSKGYMSSGELLEEMNKVVHEMLDKAIKRTESNKRSTVRGGDI